MSRLWALAASFLPAAVLAAGAASAIQAGSGDTCTTTGNGTEYTLHIAIPVGASQYGFAFGAPGATVTNAVAGRTALSRRLAWRRTHRGPGSVPKR